MTSKAGPRPGGRSARVQASVHLAAKTLLARLDRSEVSIPAIAAEAGVTPSTIYRRWGDLQDLLADIAVERLRPDGDPADTGRALGDLEAWAEQYAEEMSSRPGREMVRDVLSVEGRAGPQCLAFVRDQIDVIVERARRRGEPCPEVEVVIDRVVAPIVYRLLYGEAPTTDRVRALVAEVMQVPEPSPRVAAG